MEYEEAIKKYFESQNIKVDDIAPLQKGGVHKSTFKAGNFVVKLEHKKKRDRVQKEIDILRKIHDYEDITIFPLDEKVIEIKDKVGYYYHFFDGKPVEESNIENIFFSFGQVVAKIDLALQKVDYQKKEHDFFWDMTQKDVDNAVKAMQASEIPEIQQIGVLTKEAYGMLKQKFNREDFLECRFQLIHDDLHFNNVLYNENTQKYFIVDTSGLQQRVISREITVMISYALTNDKGEIDAKAIKDLLNGYESVIKLKKIEKEMIPALLIRRKIGEILHLWNLFNRKELDLEEYHKFNANSVRNLKVAIENYDKIMQIVLE